MIREIVNVSHPGIRKKSKKVAEVDKKVKRLVDDMIETLDSQKDPEGVGLAAPQVGINKQIFIMKFTKEDAKKHKEKSLTKVVINPKVLYKKRVTKKEKNIKRKVMEGCLSLPHFYGPLVRSSKVKLEYMNVDGETITQTFNGFPAQIVLHEVDHLNGHIFVDRLLEQDQPLYELKDGAWHEVELR